MATHPTSTSLPRPLASRLLYAGLTATLLALIAAEIGAATAATGGSQRS